MESSQLGPYRILERIGTGGMAEVVRAERLYPDGHLRQVAIKRLSRELTRDPNLVSMFRDEADLSMQLQHPNIVRVLEHGTDGSDRLFMVMEFVEGRDLRWCLATAARARQWLPIEFALTVVRDLAKALAYAHDARNVYGEPLNIVHRDVTHSNVFVSFHGEVKLADFGIARARGRQQHTRTGLIRGKVGYLSPEQVRAQPLDHRSDIFAACVILWELLTQRRLFVGETDFKTMLAVCSGDRKSPSEVRKGVPPVLDQLVLRGVEVERDSRYAHASLLAAAIEDVADRMNLDLGPDAIADAIGSLESYAMQHDPRSVRRPSDPNAITAQVAAPPIPPTRQIPAFPSDPEIERPSSPASLEFVEPWESTRTSTSIAYGLLAPEEERAHVARLSFPEHPIYVRSGLKVAKLTSFDALIRALDPRYRDVDTEISADAIEWRSLQEFAALAELDFALWTPRSVVPAASSKTHRTIAALGSLALRGATGHFAVDRDQERYTCLLEVGGLVGLMSTRPAQQMIPALAAGGVIPDPALIGAILAQIIEHGLPLAEVLSRSFDVDPELIISFRKTQAIDVLEDVLALEAADFAFEETPGWPDRGFLAGTALELVARATHSWPPSAIEHALAPARRRPMKIRADFPLVARMLRLRSDAAPVIRQLRPGRTLEQLFAKFPEGSESNRMAKSLAFIFAETGAIEFQ